MNVVELRCKEPGCQCSKKGKLLLKVYNLPESARNKGIIAEIPCPKDKSKIVKLKIE